MVQKIPKTSIEAHDKVKASGQKETHARIIYSTLMRMRGRMGTASDIAIKCRIDYTEVCRRMKEMVEDNLVYIYSERGGKTTGGNACRVYMAIPSVEECTQINLTPVPNVQQSLFG